MPTNRTCPLTKPTYSDFVSRRRCLYPFGVLRRRHAGPDGRRPAADRIDPGRRPGLVAGHLDRHARVSAGGRHPSQPASPTLRITIGDETIVATGIHRFWKAGKGWTMARELKAGDRLRMVGGTVAIKSIEADKTQPVYNLDVAENRDFFVGTKGLLVHDFSFVQPVLEPFDRQPDLASLVH